MRIVVVSAWAPWDLFNGDGLIVHHQLRILERRHDIRVIVAQSPSRAEDLANSGLSDLTRMTTFEPLKNPGLDFARRRLSAMVHGEPVHVPWVMRPRLLEEFRAQLAAFDPDVVHLIGWGTAGLWRLTGDIPTTYMAIDPWMDARANRVVPWYRRLTDRDQQRAVIQHEYREYPHLDAVALVSADDAEDMAARIPDARFVGIPNGVEAGERPGKRTTSPVIVYHGTFAVAANLTAARNLVDHVLPLVHRQRPDAKLLLVGRYGKEALGALEGPLVEVTGSVDDLREALSRGSVSVAPMTVGSGMKNKILEAMAAGLPVVTTSAGARGIGAGDGLIVHDDWAGMAQAVVELLNDPAHRSAVGDAGRARVLRDFSWERSVDRLEVLWTDLQASRQLNADDPCSA